MPLIHKQVHTTEFISTFENTIIEDLNYIKNFISAAPKAQIAPDYGDAKMVKAITSSVYPQVFAFLLQHLDKQLVIAKLREMGRRSAMIFLAIHPFNLTKKAKIIEVFREIGAHSSEKHRFLNLIKEKNKLRRFTLKKYKCIFCTDSIKIEDIDVHYCLPSAAFHQHYYNLRSLYLGSLTPRLIYVDVIKTANTDKDFCEYHVEVIA